MPAAPAIVQQLARDTAQIADPETALRALNALRQELEQIEPGLVQRALQAGASWSQIAKALGVSKQAAHRKHRHLAEQAFEAVGEGAKIRVTGEARRSIQLARDEARSLGQPTIGTEHILLGILRCPRSLAVKALNALGVDHQAARTCLQTTMPGVIAAPQPLGRLEVARDDGVSPHARRILEGSVREAVKRGDGYIGVEHLLLALLTDSRNGAVQTLEALKTTPKQIRRQLKQDWQQVTAIEPEPMA